MNYKSTTHRVNLVFNFKFWLITLLMVLLYSTVLLAQYSQTVYFDPSNSGDPDQDGSFDHPYDHVTDVDISPGTDYRFKRGTQMTLSNRVYLNYNDNIRLGAYGSGEKPILYMTDVSEDIITMQSNNNVIIDSLHLINNNTLNGGVRGIEMAPGYGGNPNTKNITISNCEIEGGWVGINVQHGSGDYYTENLTIRNCEIHHVGMDGILFRDVTNGLIEGCHIYSINQYWHTTTHGQSAGGDGIQTAHNCDNLKIYNNIIDRRNTGNKFCILIGNLEDTTEPCYTEIVGNTFYPPKDTTDNNGGVAVYLQEAGGAPATILFARNKIIGRKDHLGNSCQSAFRGDCDTLYFYYNIIDSCNFNAGVQRITSDCDYAEVFNNVFMGGDISSTNVFGVDAETAVVKNNLSAGNTGGDALRLGYVDFLEESNNIEISSSNSALFNDYLSIANWETSDFTRMENLNDGAPIGLGFDIDSIPVGNPPECGVCEFYDGTQTNTTPNIENQVFNVEENTANGTQVGIVIATDPDPDQYLTYSILSGNTSNAFQIDGISGELTVNNIDALNFETHAEFNLTVKVQDNGMGALADQAVITVNVLDVNEVPNIANQEFSLLENSPNGQQVGVVQATDPDDGQTLEYSILSGNTDNAFSINLNTGALLVNDFIILDYEVTPEFNLTIEVQDNGAVELSDQAIITVNLLNVNEAPNVADQELSLDENSPIGYEVGIVQASDPDNGQTLSYSIISGNTDETFIINGSSGLLTINNAALLDFEANQEFNLTVQVMDDGTGYLSDQANITLLLLDINEVPIIEDQDFNIEENSPYNQLVASVIATDPDIGQSLSYSILTGNIDNTFFINEISGELFVNNSSGLDFENHPEYNLIVQVQDNGAGSLTNFGAITVSLHDVNEAPIMLNQEFTVIIDMMYIENDINHNIHGIGTIQASDPDMGQNLTFTLYKGNELNAFSINNNTGELEVSDPTALHVADYFTYPLIIVAKDDSPEELQTTATVNIYVNMEYSPVPYRDSELLMSKNIGSNQFSMNVFPNPAWNYFELELDNLEPGPTSIAIFNIGGELILQNEFYNNEMDYLQKFNVDNFRKGLYLIRIRNNSTVYNSKLVKM